MSTTLSALCPPSFTSPPSSFSTFFRFKDLPTEIRLQIWAEAIWEPCIVRVGQASGHLNDEGNPYIQNPISPLFLTCHESRKEAVKARWWAWDLPWTPNRFILYVDCGVDCTGSTHLSSTRTLRTHYYPNQSLLVRYDPTKELCSVDRRCPSQHSPDRIETFLFWLIGCGVKEVIFIRSIRGAADPLPNDPTSMNISFNTRQTSETPLSYDLCGPFSSSQEKGLEDPERKLLAEIERMHLELSTWPRGHHRRVMGQHQNHSLSSITFKFLRKFQKPAALSTPTAFLLFPSLPNTLRAQIYILAISSPHIIFATTSRPPLIPLLSVCRESRALLLPLCHPHGQGRAATPPPTQCLTYYPSAILALPFRCDQVFGNSNFFASNYSAVSWPEVRAVIVPYVPNFRTRRILTEKPYLRQFIPLAQANPKLRTIVFLRYGRRDTNSVLHENMSLNIIENGNGNRITNTVTSHRRIGRLTMDVDLIGPVTDLEDNRLNPTEAILFRDVQKEVREWTGTALGDDHVLKIMFLRLPNEETRFDGPVLANEIIAQSEVSTTIVRQDQDEVAWRRVVGNWRSQSGWRSRG